MNHWIRKSIILSSVTLLGLSISAAQAQAVGWASGPARPLYPASAVGARYAAAPYAAARPIVAAQPIHAGGCNSCATAPTACANCASAVQPTTVNFAPRTWFRSRWVRVPVTAYRPLTVANQTNCAPVAQLQPCNTFRWQVQRVPVYRPLLSWLTWWRRPVAPAYFAAYPAPASPCTPTATAFAPTSSCASCTPAATTVPGPSPYYQPPTAAPAIPSVAPAIPGSRQPADLRPRLRPLEGQSPIPSATTRRVNPTRESSNTRLRMLPHRPNSAQPFSNVTPIPDTTPTRKPHESAEDQNIPQLLNPRNHTASLRDTQVWKIIPVNKSRQAETPTQRTVPHAVPTRPLQQRWDDSGWRSAK